jgi:hypothetical protein
LIFCLKWIYSALYFSKGLLIAASSILSRRSGLSKLLNLEDPIMARKRRTSAALAAARQRLAGLNKITPAPNLGPNTTLLAYQGVINDTAALEESHHQLAAQMDDSSNRFDAQENLMADWNRRVKRRRSAIRPGQQRVRNGRRDEKE